MPTPHLFNCKYVNTPLRFLRVTGSFAAEKGGNGRVIYFFAMWTLPHS
jgi:hypothetical protein